MFDPSAPHIIILLIVVLLLFGSRRLPGAAKSLGESMHIFKKSVQGKDEFGNPIDTGAPQTGVQGGFQQPAAQQTALPPAASRDQQLADLQRQVQDLQRQNAGGDSAPLSEAQHGQQPF
jgi:sec-independent protein translocase protein TatA